MINSINPLYAVNNTMMPNTPMQQVPQTGITPVQNPNLNGVNALAAYNQPVQPMTKDLKPSQPTIMQPDAIKNYLMKTGTCVTTSTGTLDSIVKKDDKYTTVYKMDISAPNDAIRKIETFDNSTGKLIRVQENYNEIKKGQLPQAFMIDIKELDPNTGKTTKFTNYYKGQLDVVKEFEYTPNGSQKEYSVSGKRKALLENSADGNIKKITEYDEKGQIRLIKTINSDEYTAQTIFYKNGIPSNIITEKQEIIPNTTGKNPMADPELIPSQPYNIGYDPKSIQGERSYYSNGAIERIETTTATGKVIHTFDLNGTLSGIGFDDNNSKNIKSVIFHTEIDGRKSYSLEENLSDDIRKTTVFSEDGRKEVIINNDKTQQEKFAYYSKEGIMLSYIEHSKDNEILLNFDKQGNLRNIH